MQVDQGLPAWQRSDGQRVVNPKKLDRNNSADPRNSVLVCPETI